jgi:hypothetical protein
MLYEKQKDNKVKCNLCARRCLINDGATGFCLVRKNEGGTLYSLVYAKAVSAGVDPIRSRFRILTPARWLCLLPRQAAISAANSATTG